VFRNLEHIQRFAAILEVRPDLDERNLFDVCVQTHCLHVSDVVLEDHVRGVYVETVLSHEEPGQRCRQLLVYIVQTIPVIGRLAIIRGITGVSVGGVSGQSSGGQQWPNSSAVY